MKIVFIKYSYYIISTFFIIGLVLVVFVRQQIEDEIFIRLIDYYFWYVFGLFSGIILAKVIIKNYAKLKRDDSSNKLVK